MKSLRIVLMANEKYAVQMQPCRFASWIFCEGNHKHCQPEYGRTWGATGEYIDKYCFINTEKEAEMVLSKTLEILRAKTPKGIKVVRVIKQVRV